MTTGWLKRSMDEASEDVKRLPEWAVQLAMAMDPVSHPGHPAAGVQDEHSSSSKNGDQRVDDRR